MKIFYQLSNYKTLAPDNGDTINTINNIKALSTFAEVYYSGTLFRPQLPGYGLIEYNSDIISRIDNSYDAYYVRDNREVFMNCPKNKPRIWMASPFYQECYEQADMIATYSEKWADILRQLGDLSRLGHTGVIFPKPRHRRRVLGELFLERQRLSVGVHRQRRAASGVHADANDMFRPEPTHVLLRFGQRFLNRDLRAFDVVRRMLAGDVRVARQNHAGGAVFVAPDSGGELLAVGDVDDEGAN